MLHSLYSVGTWLMWTIVTDCGSSLDCKVGLPRSVTSYELASLTSGSARPRAPASIRNVRPCSGSAARAASSMSCQADVTSRRDRSGPTKGRATRLARRHVQASADARLAGCRRRHSRRPSAHSRSGHWRRPPHRRGRRRRDAAAAPSGAPRGNPVRGSSANTIEHVRGRVGKITERSVRREADRVRNGDAGEAVARFRRDRARRSRRLQPRPCVPWCRSRTFRKRCTRASFDRVRGIVRLERTIENHRAVG